MRLELQWDDPDYKGLSRPGEQGSDLRRLDAAEAAWKLAIGVFSGVLKPFLPLRSSILARSGFGRGCVKTCCAAGHLGSCPLRSGSPSLADVQRVGTSRH